MIELTGTRAVEYIFIWLIKYYELLFNLKLIKLRHFQVLTWQVNTSCQFCTNILKYICLKK